eukprot:TRINITY_DN2728_c0_g2_i1.p1 TRINITY_DN2728_c0_g2~~TRINITY_DN2728_c0_g2_i1.p1  ORF type:complete len:311 (-),score=60.61 TRINITY_DN2728_c0_g2_i1:21-953(-)
MSFFEKLFFKSTEFVIDKDSHFDTANDVWVGFIRDDVSKDRIKYELQTYFNVKDWNVVHTGTATMTVFSYEPYDRSIQFKIGFNSDKQRMLHAKYKSFTDDDQSIDIFHDIGNIFADKYLFVSQDRALKSDEEVGVMLHSDEKIAVPLQEAIYTDTHVDDNQIVAFLNNVNIHFFKRRMIRFFELHGFYLKKEKISTLVLINEDYEGARCHIKLTVGKNTAGKRMTKIIIKGRLGSIPQETLEYLSKNSFLKSQKSKATSMSSVSTESSESSLLIIDGEDRGSDEPEVAFLEDPEETTVHTNHTNENTEI